MVKSYAIRYEERLRAAAILVPEFLESIRISINNVIADVISFRPVIFVNLDHHPSRCDVESKVMADLTLRFITESDPVSWMIRKETISPVSHVEFGLPDGTWLGAHFSGGVQIRKANYCKPTFEDIYSLPVEQDQYDAIMEFARSQIGKPYDMAAIMGFLAHERDWRCADHWFCSEYVAAAFEAGQVYPLRVSHYLNCVTPRDLYMAPMFYGRRVPSESNIGLSSLEQQD